MFRRVPRGRGPGENTAFYRRAARASFRSRLAAMSRRSNNDADGAREPGRGQAPAAGGRAHAGRDTRRTEVAATAARLIAEEGLDYATAKRKAQGLVGGSEGRWRAEAPDNALVEQELRRYLSTFMADRQPLVLGALRLLSLQLMQRLQRFQPHLVGAVLNGTATEHSNVHLHLYVDSVKDVEVFLLDQGVEFEAVEGSGGRDGPLETLQFVVRPARARATPREVGVVLDLHAVDAIRVAPALRSAHPDLHPVEASGRAGLAQLRALLADRHPELLA